MSLNKVMCGFFGFGMIIASIGVLLPVIGRPSSCGMDVVRQSNMRSFAIAMENYVHDFNGRLFPAEQWHEVMDPWLGIERDDPAYFSGYDSQFYLLPFHWDDLQFPEGISSKELAQIPFMIEEQQLSLEGTAVVFWDASVRMLNDDEFEQLIDMSEAVPLGIRKQRGDP